MSLTSHIKDSSSPIRAWLDSSFPTLVEALNALRADMPSDLDARTIRPVAGVPLSTIGIAIDYRIRYHLAVTPTEDLVAGHGATILLEQHLNEFEPENPALWRDTRTGPDGMQVSGRPLLADPAVAHLAPAAVFQAIDRLVADTQPVGRTLDADTEQRLDRACAVLALYEEVFRTKVVAPTSPLAAISMEASADAVFARIPRSWIDDIAAVCGRLLATVALTGEAILNPTFALSRDVGGADADLVLGGCLIDVKSTLNPRLDPVWLRQLLGYALLDSDNVCHIDSLGVLLARQAVMTRWPLEALLDAAAGSSRPSFETMRADFAGVVSTLGGRPGKGPSGPRTASSGTRPMIMRIKFPAWITGGSGPTQPTLLGPHPSTLDVIGLAEAEELTGRSRSVIRRVIANGRLAAIPPRSDHPAGYGSGFRISRADVEALFPPKPRPEPHECGGECAKGLHVTYLAAQMADRESAQAFLRHAFWMGALTVRRCVPSDVATEGLLQMAVERYVEYGHVVIPPGSPWTSWRVVWRDRFAARPKA
jgi:hypothetical protein